MPEFLKSTPDHLLTPEQLKARIYRKAYYRINREKLLAAQRKNRLENHEVILNRERAYKKKNPEAVKASAKKSAKKYYAKHRDRVLEANKQYRLANAEKIAARNRDRYENPISRVMRRDRERVWVENNPDLVRLYSSRARDKRAQRMSKPIDPARIVELQALQNGCCVYCQLPFYRGRFHVDHIMPLALGGTNDSDNLQLLCRTCNLRKGAKHPATFEQQIGFQR